MNLSRTFNSLILSGSRCSSVNGVQFYSVYPKHYVKPVFKKDQQEQLYKSLEEKEVTHIAIKPALNDDTSSEFHDELIRKFINYLTRKGNKRLARKIVEDTFENIKIAQLDRYYNTAPEHRDKVMVDPKVIFHTAVENCKPVLELQKISRGGINYQVPVPLNSARARFFSMNWLIRTAQDKGNTDKMCDVLAKEIMDAAQNKGRVIKKKHDLHKQCDANRAYAHYRWL